jgi:tetratricopeptide (TPR) repeat protein
LKLTRREKAILHLWDFARDRDKYNPSLDVTQDGIASVVAAERSVVSQLMKQMTSNGTVEARRARAGGAGAMRNCYFLTPKGEMEARRLEGLLKDVREGAQSGLAARDALVERGTRRGLATMKVLADEPVAGSRLSAPSERGPAGPVERISVPQRIFGRERELAAAAAALDAGRSLVIVGIGGIGKTALARAALAGREHVWVDWPSTGSAGALASALSRRSLRTEGRSLPDDPVLLSRELASVPPASVVAINDWQDDPEATRLISSLALAGRLVVTSRQRPVWLGLPGQPRAASDAAQEEIELGPLAASDSLLLLESLGVPERFREALAAAAGGVPLALEVASRLDPRAARSESMRTIYRAVTRGLCAREAEALRRLSGIEGPIDPEVAAACGLASYFDMSALRDKALLSPDPSTQGALRVHDVIRDLFRSPEGADAAARYHRSVGTPRSLLRAAKTSADGSGETLLDILRRDLAKISDGPLAVEMKSLVDAVVERWSKDGADASRISALRLAAAQLQLTLGGDALDAVDRVDAAALPPHLRSDYHRTLGIALFLHGKHTDAEAELLEAESLAREARDDEARGRAAISLLHYYAQSKRPDGLFSAFARSEAVLARLGDWYLMRALHNFAIYLVDAGLLDKAEAVIARAQEAGERIGDPDYLSTVQNLHVHVLIAKGSLEEAERCAADMETAMLAAGHPLGLGSALEAQGIIAARRGETERAQRRFSEALDTLGAGYPGETADLLATAAVEMARADRGVGRDHRWSSLRAARDFGERFLSVASKAESRVLEVKAALSEASAAAGRVPPKVS